MNTINPVEYGQIVEQTRQIDNRLTIVEQDVKMLLEIVNKAKGFVMIWAVAMPLIVAVVNKVIDKL